MHTIATILRGVVGGGGAGRLTLLVSALICTIPSRLERRYAKISAVKRSLTKALLGNGVVRYKGCEFHLVDAGSVVVLSEMHEPWAWDYLKIPEGGVFVDVGAHIGRYTIPIGKSLDGKGLVVAVEPEPGNYATLLENLKLNRLSNVLALNLAAWSENGELDLHLAERMGQHSLKGQGNRCIKVPARPLGEVLAEHGVDRVDLVKVDVEGAEVEVLEGMRNTIQQFKPKLLVEVFWENAEDTSRLLEELGYQVKEIPHSRVIEGFYLFAVPELVRG